MLRGMRLMFGFRWGCRVLSRFFVDCDEDLFLMTVDEFMYLRYNFM